MKIIGIDYGRKKIGLAIGDTQSKFAEPLSVIRFKSEAQAFIQIGELVMVEKVEKIVLGVSEGKMAQETRKFGQKLQKELGIPIIFQDETLTSLDAQELSIAAGINRKKRREMEDAYAASIILQNFLGNL